MKYRLKICELTLCSEENISLISACLDAAAAEAATSPCKSCRFSAAFDTPPLRREGVELLRSLPGDGVPENNNYF